MIVSLVLQSSLLLAIILAISATLLKRKSAARYSLLLAGLASLLFLPLLGLVAQRTSFVTLRLPILSRQTDMPQVSASASGSGAHGAKPDTRILARASDKPGPPTE